MSILDVGRSENLLGLVERGAGHNPARSATGASELTVIHVATQRMKKLEQCQTAMLGMCDRMGNHGVNRLGARRVRIRWNWLCRPPDRRAFACSRVDGPYRLPRS